MFPPDPPPRPRPPFLAPAIPPIINDPGFRAALGWNVPPPPHMVVRIAFVDGRLVIRPR